jgi:hypothetical protein
MCSGFAYHRGGDLVKRNYDKYIELIEEDIQVEEYEKEKMQPQDETAL